MAQFGDPQFVGASVGTAVVVGAAVVGAWVVVAVPPHAMAYSIFLKICKLKTFFGTPHNVYSFLKLRLFKIFFCKLDIHQLLG